jgi:dolichol-phosphate mannosyltransferase
MGQVTMTTLSNHSIAVIIPCYRVAGHILQVIERIGVEVAMIIVVDDACPENSGKLVQAQVQDPRVKVIYHEKNAGVGAACCSGFNAALALGASILVKLDGDGQMPPELIGRLVRAIVAKQADAVKGNRFHRLGATVGMPTLRLFGNAALSFLSKISTGYWQLFDPTNGFLAMHAAVFSQLDSSQLAPRYFFESDLLFQLGRVRARVRELPMKAHYADEQSSLRPMAMIAPFAFGHTKNFLKRLVNQYFVHGFSLASVQLLLGILLLLFGLIFGALEWWQSYHSGVAASAGTVMLAALPVVLGVEFLLAWLNFDVQAEPRDAIWPLLVTEQHLD